MITMLTTILGGIGLFLLGIILMTDGLKAAAGDALQQILRRFTGTPGRSLLSGAGITALVQSSSATTVTTIGFVSAGLLTFPQALGVIFGANLGSTSTGWIVSLLGLKLSIGSIALPMIGIGALLRLLGRGRWTHIGLALAGFGLLFVGIDVLREGTAGLAERFDLAGYGNDWLGRFLLVGMGLIMAVLMQSSSAAVATTLTALHSGAIGLEQAAALVIGQNLGTTVKAALVCIGATIPAKRTALAHIQFNFITSLLAFLLLPLFVRLVAASPGLAEANEALIIAGFHTAFNLLGIAVFLPLLHPFARWIERLIPEPSPRLTRHLHQSVREVPEVALDAVDRTLQSIADELLSLLELRLGGTSEQALQPRLAEVEDALRETRRFLGEVAAREARPDVYDRRLRLIHALDHMERLARATGKSGVLRVLRNESDTTAQVNRLREQVADVRQRTTDASERDELRSDTARCAEELAAFRREQRAVRLHETAAGLRAADDVLERLDAIRWLDHLGYHVWRFSHYLYPAITVDGVNLEATKAPVPQP